VYFDNKWKRKVGRGIPGYCDYPACGKDVTRDLEHVCGSMPFGGSWGCGLFFCPEHLAPGTDDSVIALCERCAYNLENKPYNIKPSFTPTPEPKKHV
jgi:hypothetical protein